MVNKSDSFLRLKKLLIRRCMMNYEEFFSDTQFLYFPILFINYSYILIFKNEKNKHSHLFYFSLFIKK